jgi:2-amino-4-hydroxy-6-hydroxymethyldihydropteridine diphosphokinase
LSRFVRETVTAYIGLGANLGDASAAVTAAMRAIGNIQGIALGRQSSLYASAPIDSGGPDYVNAVVQVQTTLSAPDLLSALQSIEAQAGRERPYRNAPRTLDLDVLLYGSAVVQSATLTVPHPRMFQRAFVLLPLADVAPALVSSIQMQAVAKQSITRLTEPESHKA